MATKLRSKLSENNKYWINRHRYYELKHFCLQYPLWRQAYYAIDDAIIPPVNLMKLPTSNIQEDITSKYAIMKVSYLEKMKMVENAAFEADKELYRYILKAVTEELSYNYLKTRLDIPCCKDTYYDRYRKFFYILNRLRD